MIKNIFIFLSILVLSKAQKCRPSITTASGPYARSRICAGKLIFQDNFNTLDKHLWQPEVTLGGGGNGEFQWYDVDDENSFVKKGKLHIKPTLTSDKIDVENGHVNLGNRCTDDNRVNCHRRANADKNIIINPIKSARLSTLNSFKFKYGRVEIVAKNPRGDWLWPGLWLLDAESKYNPYSGEIDIMESRGNSKYVTRFESTVHYGLLYNENHKSKGNESINARGFDKDFHKYGVIWNNRGIKFFLDGVEFLSVPVGKGYWQQGGTKMAPFDQEFYLLMNLAVGGTGGFFPDNDGTNKPWRNNAPTAMKDFWTNRQKWLPSWSDREKSSFIIDSIKIWAI